jgi:hypothetical protein
MSKTEGEAVQKMTGACLCGHIRYSAEVEPIFTAICHCESCQRQAGAAFSVVVAVPRSALAVEGWFKTFEGRGGSGKPTHRHFCSECGSPVFAEIDVLPDVAFIMAGTLDDRAWVRPDRQLWCENAQPWTQQNVEMHHFEKMPI